MKRISVTEAQADFSRVLRDVTVEHCTIELTEGNAVVAWLTPPATTGECSVLALQSLLRSLPSLNDDAPNFARDVMTGQSMIPAETNAWD
jgi:antitoxin (DNA-binding transcriptional repressor) of toxin-antitoxin stability system